MESFLGTFAGLPGSFPKKTIWCCIHVRVLHTFVRGCLEISVNYQKNVLCLKAVQCTTYKHTITVTRIFEVTGKLSLVKSFFKESSRRNFCILQLCGKLLQVHQYVSRRIWRKFLSTRVEDLQSTGCNAIKNELLTKFLKWILKILENLQEELCHGVPVQYIGGIPSQLFLKFQKIPETSTVEVFFKETLHEKVLYKKADLNVATNHRISFYFYFVNFVCISSSYFMKILFENLLRYFKYHQKFDSRNFVLRYNKRSIFLLRTEFVAQSSILFFPVFHTNFY